MRRFLKAGRRVPASLTLLLLLIAATPATAFQFTLGEVEGSLDTTVSYGLNYRVSERDKDIIGLQEGGHAYSHNYDDGNLNYNDDEYFSKVFKITSDLELKYQNFGLFLRGSAFHDFQNASGDGERTELEGDALDMIGEDAELLDAFIWWDFEVGGMPGTLKVGNQVLSWGESTFIQNSINAINPIDVNKLRVPGSELKEALIPVGIISASLAANEYVSFEAFYQYDWEKTQIDPVGAYWSANDFAGEGGEKVMLGFGQFSDMGTRPVAETFLGVPRAPDIYADNDGQYGVAMHVFAPGLNNTEFGFFFMNYHSRLPLISSWTGSLAGAASATPAGTALAVNAPTIIPAAFGTWATTLATSGFTNEAGAVNAGIAAGVGAVTTTSARAGEALAIKILDVATAAYTNAGGGPTGLFAAQTAVGASSTAVTTGVAQAAGQDSYAKTARYQLEYPEDIKLFGVSFNTTLPGSGVALQGEVSHRQDVPLQIDDLEVLFATLGPISAGAAAFNQLATYGGLNTSIGGLIANLGQPIYVQGYKRLDVTQVQTTATKLFGPTFGADQFTLVGEVGLTYIHSMPSKDRLRFEGPGTPISGNTALSGAHYNKTEPSSAFADDTSWGYQLVGKLDFNNAIGAVTLSPRIAWAHDVDGTSPGPGGNFIEDRKAVTVGLGADYQNSWSADLSYTDFFGAGRYNLINDRDFISFNVKYSF